MSHLTNLNTANIFTSEIKIADLVGTPLESSNGKDEIKRLRSTHPVYSDFSPVWEMAENFYRGGESVLCGGYISKHHREDEQEFNERVKRADYENYVALVVDFFTNFIFSESIRRDGGSDTAFFDEFRLDVDRRGNDIDHFMRRLCTKYQLYGTAYVLVDSPNVDATTLTKLQEEEQGLRPYWVLISPGEILDWDKDDFGNFTYVKRCQRLFRRIGGQPSPIEKYTEWTPQFIRITTMDVSNSRRPEILGTQAIPNRLGEVPIVAAIFDEDQSYPDMGVSFVKDIIYIARSVLNTSSLIDEFKYRQCFNFLAVQTAGPLVSQSEDDGEIGTSTLWEYPVGAERPAYVTPPVDPAKFLQDERDYKKVQIFELAAQNLQSRFGNGESSSGFSQSQSFARTVPFIAKRGDNLEGVESRAMRLTMRYRKATWDGVIKYKDRYEQTNVMDGITQLQSAFKDLAMPSKTFVKTQLIRISNEVDNKQTPQNMEFIANEIETEIDKDFEGWQQKVLATGGSPAAQNKPKTADTLASIKAQAQVPNVAATVQLPNNTK